MPELCGTVSFTFPEKTCAGARANGGVGELGVEGGERDERVEGEEFADASSESVAILRFNFERPRKRSLLGRASPTRLERRVDKLPLDRVLPCNIFLLVSTSQGWGSWSYVQWKRW